MKLKNAAIIGLSIVCMGFSVLAEQGLPLRKFRESGDSLDISIQQELDRAVDLGVVWIKTKQSSDGSWGVSNKLETTALCTLALASQGDLTLSNILHAALQYLEESSKEQNPSNFPAIAWRAAALRVTGATGCATEQSCALFENSETPPLFIDAILRRELLLGLGLREQEEVLQAESQEHYNYLARQLDAETACDLLQMWLNARVINRVGKGQILNPQGQKVDWRRISTRKIISTQKIDLSGGGFWEGSDETQILQNTALAILISKEL